jgi:RNA polymerase sigma-70 factor (ECF subfamily)
LPISTVDVEDVAAEVLLKIVDDDYALLRKFKRISSLPTYLTIVTRRIAMKKMIRRQRAAELGHSVAHRAGMNEDATDEAEAIASAEEVEKMLESLPAREAEVVRMYHLKFLNYRQIGKKLGISENSVGPILANARRRLKNAAEQRSA